jgi:transcription elongation factor Elf1
MSLYYEETQQCPNCGEEIEVGVDHKSLTYDALCHECGFTLESVKSFLNLHDLNAERAEIGLDQLTELPKQEFEQTNKSGHKSKGNEDEA